LDGIDRDALTAKFRVSKYERDLTGTSRRSRPWAEAS